MSEHVIATKTPEMFMKNCTQIKYYLVSVKNSASNASYQSLLKCQQINLNVKADVSIYLILITNIQKNLVYEIRVKISLKKIKIKNYMNFTDNPMIFPFLNCLNSWVKSN